MVRRLLVILALGLSIRRSSVILVPRCGLRKAIARQAQRVQSFIVQLTGNPEPVANLVTPNCRRSLITSLSIYLTVIKTLIFQSLLNSSGQIVGPKRAGHHST